MPAMNTALAFPMEHGLPSPQDFHAYARAIQAFPTLSLEREQALVRAWQEDRSREAARELVLSHLRLVVRVVRDHAAYGVSEGDLAQEGTVGLMRAVHGFRLEHGVRLATYAVRWIEAEVREFIFKNWRLVRLGSGSAMKKLFFGYRKTVAALRENGGDRPLGVSEAQIAQALGVTQDQVAAASGYFRGTDLSLSGPVDEDEPAQSAEARTHHRHDASLEAPQDPADWAQEQADAPKYQRAIAQGWSTLPERDRDILQARRWEQPPVGLVELGQRHGVSAERVRQIEQRAWLQLTQSTRAALEAPAAL